jgi:RND family efflux transporter MFP subunit
MYLKHKTSKMKTTYYSGLIALGTALAFSISSCSNEQPGTIAHEKPVIITVGTASSLTQGKLSATGQVEARETAIISTRIMGFVTSVKVKPGDQVKKGQLLATISNADILAKRAQAQAMVTEAEAALKDAQRDHERFAALYKEQSASEKEFENATLHFNSVKAKTEAARQMQREAESMLTYTNLTAPFSGVVASKNIDEGSMTNPGMPLFSIENTSGFQVNASVPETDIAFIRVGSQADIEVKSTGKVYAGKVTQVSPSSRMSGGQYQIKIAFTDADKQDLYSGMYVQARITPTGKVQSHSSVMVPASAVIEKDQLTGVYTIGDNQTALLRWVKPGKTYGDHVEILSGLQAEEKFIATSEGKLYNGAPVTMK